MIQEVRQVFSPWLTQVCVGVGRCGVKCVGLPRSLSRPSGLQTIVPPYSSTPLDPYLLSKETCVTCTSCDQLLPSGIVWARRS